MPLNTLIRDGEPEDARVLARIHTETRAIAMPWLAVVHNEQETEQWMADIVVASQRVRVAVLDGNTIVGFTAWVDRWLEQLYIRPGYQGRGIGSDLFRDTCTAATESFRFWVFQRNVAARLFYEHRGSRLVEVTDGLSNEEREPDALYEQAILRS